MYETYATVVGTVISDLKRRRVNTDGDEVLSFRVAANARRLDRASNEWRDGAKLYVTVSCWNKLVQNVGATLGKGDPVIVYGELQTTSYQTKDGQTRSGLELRARGIGPDLSRCQALVSRRASALNTAAQRDQGPLGSAMYVVGASEDPHHADLGDDADTRQFAEPAEQGIEAHPSASADVDAPELDGGDERALEAA
jgi:single-strand DNA-binding protein